MAHKNHDNAVDKKTESDKADQDQLREEIQQLAYRLFCQCGYEHGHDLVHWVEAERQVFERYEGRHRTHA